MALTTPSNIPFIQFTNTLTLIRMFTILLFKIRLIQTYFQFNNNITAESARTIFRIIRIALQIIKIITLNIEEKL